MVYYISLFPDGSTFEQSPASDTYQEVEIPDRSVPAAEALMTINSFEVSQLLADVYLAGVRDGERAARTGVSSRRPGPPTPAAPADTPR